MKVTADMVDRWIDVLEELDPDEAKDDLIREMRHVWDQLQLEENAVPWKPIYPIGTRT